MLNSIESAFSLLTFSNLCTPFENIGWLLVGSITCFHPNAESVFKMKFRHYNAFNVYRRELAPGTVSLTGDRAQGDDSKHWAYSIRSLHVNSVNNLFFILSV